MEPQRITVLYDSAEDQEKAECEKAGKPCPLAYAQVADALSKRGHTVRTVAVSDKISRLVDEIEKDTSDVIFNLCEQRELQVVGLLELYGKCFTGNTSTGFVLAGDKALTKKVLHFHGLRYPGFCTLAKGRVEWSEELEFPLIVKPVAEDASIGIDKGSVVGNITELLERVAKVQAEFSGGALVEEFIDGREIYVGVVGNDRPEPLPLLEWDLSGLSDGPRIAGAEAKWDRDSEGFKAAMVFPEDVPANVVTAIQSAAVTAYQALRLRGYGRVDLRVQPPTGAKTPAAKATPKANGTKTAPEERPTGGVKPGNGTSAQAVDGWHFHIIEVNPNCWLEKRNEIAMAARKHGLSYPDLLERIIELAHNRQPVVAAV